MKNIIYGIISISIILLPFNLSGFLAGKAESANIIANNLIIKNGEIFSIDISLSDVHQISVADFSIVYDKNKISFVEAREASFFSPIFALFTNVSEVGDTKRLKVSIATEEVGKSGSGILAQIDFKALVPEGSAIIKLEGMTLYPSNFSDPIIATISSELKIDFLPNNTANISTISESWTFGSENPNSSNYWDLQAVNPKNTFFQGDSVCVLSKVLDIKSNHRWKTEFYRQENLIWVDESPWLFVGTGWDYANAMPIINNVQIGDWRTLVWLDIGQGYELMSDLNFSVEEKTQSTYYEGAKTCGSWSYGPGSIGDVEYWNFQCIDEKTIYNEGERAHILAKYSYISKPHAWKIRVFKDNVFQWEYETNLANLNSEMWTYVNFTPYIDNLRTGNYQADILFKDNLDFFLVDSLSFSVLAKNETQIPFWAKFDTGLEGFVIEDNSSDATVNASLDSSGGRNAMLIETIGLPGMHWHTQTKKTGLPLQEGRNYNGKVWLKGDKAGKIYISGQKESSPWDSLGLWKEIQISTEWKEYDFSFTYLQAYPAHDNRISIMHGGYIGKIWVDDFRIE